ncbi:hypothetical protein EAF04_002130 [Stromatinia cepivora]|nr:hypothetical protein EAF04_002130 [Stromatinia cepivora]
MDTSRPKTVKELRNHAIAANPVDWKIQDYDFFIEKYPNVLGSDVCGVVVAVGDGVTLFKVGDRVSGFAAVIYNSEIDHGAWQTYTLLRDIATTKIPATIPFEEGSVFPMAFATAAIALFVNLGIPKPPAVMKDADKSAILVWSGSSSVGLAAVQIAKALGLKVFATASQSNHAYVKSLGASEVFDYHDPEVNSKILKAANQYGVTITKVFDAISENGSLKLASVILVKSRTGGQLAIVLHWPADEPKPNGVDVSLTVAMRSGQDQAGLGAWFFNEWPQTAIQEGAVMASPKIRLVEGGIGATQKVFDALKAGVSATKFVVKI